MNGVIVVYKESGCTSFSVIARMRGILKERHLGHSGTLDPNAVGVLPVFIGNATRLTDFLPESNKIYRASMRLGISTRTEDIWGEVIEEKTVNVTEKEVKEALLSFGGGYSQIPPMYSAKKIKGKKLVDLARKDITVEREPVFVGLKNLSIEEISLPDITFSVECTKGTYIRTLCADIGKKLGLPACMTSLERTGHGVFLKNQARTISEIEKYRDEGRLNEIILPIESLMPKQPRAYIKTDFMKALENGNPLSAEAFSHIDFINGTRGFSFEEPVPGREKYLMLSQDTLVFDNEKQVKAVYRPDRDINTFRCIKMF